MGNLDAYLARRLSEIRAEMAWPGGDTEAIQAWQDRLRNQLRRLLGGFEQTPPPLDPELGDPTLNGGYTIRRIAFSTRPGLQATGYWLEPAEAPAGPAMICLPGHGVGVRGIVGLSDEPYEAEFALQCVRRGYRTLALEPLSFGERMSSRVGPHGWSCEADAKTALMLGETLLGWRVWEVMRAVDWLLTRPDVDPKRIGVMGISGGGTVGLWSAALDTRIAAAGISGAFCPFRDSILAIDHCLDNFVPGVLRLIEMPDLAGLIGPRKLFVENGIEDPIFPRQGFETAARRAAAMFSEAGVPANFGFELFNGSHQFHGKALFAWLRKSGI